MKRKSGILNILRHFVKGITSRFFILSFLLLSQLIGISILPMFVPNEYTILIYIIAWVMNIICCVYISYSPASEAYKIGWMSMIIIFQTSGFIFYLLFANKRTTKRQIETILPYSKNIIKFSAENDCLDELKELDYDAYTQCQYIHTKGHNSVYKNTEVTYYKIGQEVWQPMLDELNKAKKFIFLEYFIIEPGEFWNSILEILKVKAAEGVDVRLIYDDFGCMTKLKYGYDKYLKGLGIKVQVFNRYLPFVNIKMNNRDHRKICVIDGNVGFSGGLNLADEYVNKVQRFGVWKDNAFRLVGEGVYGLTLLFLSNWGNITKTSENFFLYSYENNQLPEGSFKSSGYVQPFGDIPYDYESIGKNVYLNLFYKANKYLYIATPYLIIEETTRSALKQAAQSGVDVRIVVPSIPDKKAVYEVTQSFFKDLLIHGVKIYKYTPGFIHDKTILVDDKFAAVGTINMDLRSMYLHFENSTLMYNVDAIKDIKEDFDQIFDDSTQYTLLDYKKVNLFRKFSWIILRLFSPLF
ncbi:MAG: cardiolipin synthase [Bacilli bacterium]